MLTPILPLVLAGNVAMTPELVRQAIADEKAQTHYQLMWAYGGGYFTTPYSRVVGAAKAAKREYKPFSEADVTADLLRPEIDVVVFPEAKGRVDAIVIAPRGSKDRTAVMQPTTATATTTEFQNLYGARFEGVGLVATFPLSVLSEQNEVRIVSSHGEVRIAFKLAKVK